MITLVLQLSKIVLVNYINHCYTYTPIFSKGIFPDELKIAGITPMSKGGDDKEIGNYKSISVLPRFSKILERIMYNRPFNHLTKKQNSLLKTTGFQKGHFAEHTIIQLINQLKQVRSNFENNEYTLSVFIDLSKAFDTVDHQVLINTLSIMK